MGGILHRWYQMWDEDIVTTVETHCMSEIDIPPHENVGSIKLRHECCELV